MKSLTKAEEQVMQVLWTLGQGFLKDIAENQPEPKTHTNTIATILKILCEKNFVDYEVQGRNNLYRPRITREDYGKRSAQQLVRGYFEGSAVKLVSQFVSDNKLSVQELEVLLEQIKKAKNDLP
jgi:BlaI family transcriptional regulator, penicillinase repressor